VQNAAVVQVAQGREDLERRLQDPQPLDAALVGAQPVEGAALHQLHYEVGSPFFPQVVDGHHAGVAEGGQRPHLLGEALALDRVNVFVEQLDRHLAAHAFVVGAPDLGHAPRTNRFDQPITTGENFHLRIVSGRVAILLRPAWP